MAQAAFPSLNLSSYKLGPILGAGSFGKGLYMQNQSVHFLSPPLPHWPVYQIFSDTGEPRALKVVDIAEQGEMYLFCETGPNMVFLAP